MIDPLEGAPFEVRALVNYAQDMERQNTALRKALFMCAAHCQGGHSTAGRAAAELLGVPFPVRMGDLIAAAVKEKLDPTALWPWYPVGRRS